MYQRFPLHEQGIALARLILEASPQLAHEVGTLRGGCHATLDELETYYLYFERKQWWELIDCQDKVVHMFPDKEIVGSLKYITHNASVFLARYFKLKEAERSL